MDWRCCTSLNAGLGFRVLGLGFRALGQRSHGFWASVEEPTNPFSTLTLNPKPQTPNPKPQTPHPKPQTPNPKPQTPQRGDCTLLAARLFDGLRGARDLDHEAWACKNLKVPGASRSLNMGLRCSFRVQGSGLGFRVRVRV